MERRIEVKRRHKGDSILRLAQLLACPGGAGIFRSQTPTVRRALFPFMARSPAYADEDFGGPEGMNGTAMVGSSGAQLCTAVSRAFYH